MGSFVQNVPQNAHFPLQVEHYKNEYVFNEAKRSVILARCASSGGVLGVENLAPLIMIFWFTNMRVSGVGRPMFMLTCSFPFARLVRRWVANSLV